MFLIKAIRCNLDPKVIDNRPLITFVILGGGGSAGIDNLHFLLKLAEGIKKQNEFPAKVRVILLPHIAGTAREIDQVGFEEKNKVSKLRARLEIAIGKRKTRDPAKQSTLADAARILNQAIGKEELGIKGKLGIIGVSAGGVQAIELAKLLGERCSFLALADSPGMTEHPNLKFDFYIGQLLDTLVKHGSLNKALDELYSATSTPNGNLQNPWQLIMDYFKPERRKAYAHAAIAWGMEKRGSEFLNKDVLKHDSTEEARKEIRMPVIISPVSLSRLNLLLHEMKKTRKDIKSVKDMKLIREKDPVKFDQECLQILRAKFPNVESNDIHYAPYEGVTHTSIAEQPFWDNLVNEIAEVLDSELRK